MVLGVKEIRDDEARKLIRTDADIRTAVQAWCGKWSGSHTRTGDPVRAETEYGHISQWETRQVTTMSYLFDNQSKFNEDISGWDVGNVTNMYGMFFNATSFNQDLSDWDVRNAKNMQRMFYAARSFNQDLSGWDVRNVKDMREMFQDAISLEKRPSWYKENFYIA